MPDLVKIRVAADQKHISGDALLQHLLACDIVCTQGKEDPSDISLDNHIRLSIFR